MIDTIHIWLSESNIPKNDWQEGILKLVDRYETKTQNNGMINYYGFIENMRFGISDRGLSIKGSLSRFLTGSNFNSLGSDGIRKALQKLSDFLQLPLEYAKLSRLDICHDLVMLHKPELYLRHCGEDRYLKRYPQPDSLLYRNQSNIRQFLMYDKLKEAKQKGNPIPERYIGKQVLRLEYRFMKSLKKSLKYPISNLNQIANPDFLKSMESKWKAMYHSINKNRSYDLNIQSIHSPKDLTRELIIQGINHIGGEANLFQLVDELKRKGNFSDRVYPSRAKRMLKNYLKMKSSDSYDNDLIIELDQKVDAITFI